jgi:hypothetical protein
VGFGRFRSVGDFVKVSLYTCGNAESGSKAPSI